MKNSLIIFAILILTAILFAFSESRTITGKITDAVGNPLEGVTVSVKGTNIVTSTDTKGDYKITVAGSESVLVFAMAGYNTVEVNVGNRNIINITLKGPVLRMDEVAADAAGIRHERAGNKSFMVTAAPAPAGYQTGYGFNRYNNNFNTEGYAPVNENGYRDVRHNPLSTFSIDVDNASYSNIRRFINMGQLPPPDAVRIEEMINYFKYDYAEPDVDHPFSVYTEIARCPWNTRHLLFQVGLKGKSISKSTLPPSNLVFLIDVSGSMNSPNKLPLLKSAFGMLVNELRPQDRVAIVVYAGAAGLVLESTPGNRKEVIMRAIDHLHAGGSTAGGAGLRLAYAEAGRNFIRSGNNRIILATDGDFNVGESSNGGMERLVEEEREKGVFITVLGFGMGNYKDDKMEIIADKGNGNYSYIDNLQEAQRVLVREFGGTLFTIAKDVKFQIEFNPAKIESYRLIGYENRLLNDEDFNDDRKDAGEMGAGHNVTALYELIPAGSDEYRPVIDPLRYQRTDTRETEANDREYQDARKEYLNIKIRYKKPDGKTSRLFEKPVRGPVRNIEYASDNLRFAAAVSEFGMLLRNSEYKADATLTEAINLANGARGEDEDGYRAELVRLIKTVKGMNLLADTE
jgi:Ca-activated chloride channel family protein